MTKLAAVTGATGFLGRYIVRALLQNGWRVRILSRIYPVHEQFSDLSFEVVPGDLSNRDALKALVQDAHMVIHAAGLIKARHAQDFHRVNVEGTQRLVEAVNMCAAPVRMLLVSSMAARAPHLSPYAASKNAAEEIARRGLQSPHEWMITRPAAVYGPWDRETLSLFRAVRLGLAPRPGVSGARVTLIHARDVASAVVALSAGGRGGDQYEISDARHQGYAWEEITQMAARHMGMRTIALALPSWSARLAGRIGSVWPPFSAEPAMLTIDKMQEIFYPDWSSAPERQPPDFLWRPEIDLNCGFLETIGWYQARGWLSGGGKINMAD